MANDNTGKPDQTDNEAPASIGGGAGTVPAWSDPDIVLSSPAGIAATTPQNAILVSGGSASYIAGQDINQMYTGNAVLSVRYGISLFTYGKATHADKPNQETGMPLHAASGKVSVQAQSDKVSLTADKHITIASTTQSVEIAAKGHVLLTAGGAYIKLEGGNIEIHAPGKVEFKSSLKTLTGPKSDPYAMPDLPRAQALKPTDLEARRVYTDGQPIPAMPYKATFSDGSIRKGVTNASGLIKESNVPPGSVTVEYGKDPNKPTAHVEMEADEDFQHLFKI
jgi:type VI secretion system secreted protein VgrG